MDGWNTILSYWVEAYFQGFLLLVSARVYVFPKTTVDRHSQSFSLDKVFREFHGKTAD